MRHCPACQADVSPVITLSEKMTMVDACPKCGRELGEAVKAQSTFVVQPPIQPTSPAQTSPGPQAQSASRPAGEVDYVSALRNRQAFVEGEILKLGAYKQEAALLRKMLAPVTRRRRAVKLRAVS